MNILGDCFSKPCFLSEPFPSQSSNRVPAYLNIAQLYADIRFLRGYHIGSVPRPSDCSIITFPLNIPFVKPSFLRMK